MELGGIPLRLIDTAGLRDSGDPIEQMGVERSRRAMEEAELILVVLDQSQPAREEDAALIRAATERAPTIAVLNKRDLPCLLEWTEQLDLAASVPVCAKTGAGLDGLAELVAQTFPGSPAPPTASCSPTSARRRPPAGPWRRSAGSAKRWTWGSPPTPCSPTWRRP